MASTSLRKHRKKHRRNGDDKRKKRPPGRPPGVPWTVAPVKHNPPVLTDVVDFILPGFGGFAGTRIVNRVTASLIAKKWPRFAKHAGFLATLGGFGLAWFAAHRIRKLAPYHTPIVVGSGIAVLQTAVQTYVPRYGWLVGHPQEDLALPAAEQPDGGQLEEAVGMTPDEAYVYNQALDNGRYQDAPRTRAVAPAQPSAQAASSSDIDPLDDLLSEMADDDNYGGVFAN